MELGNLFHQILLTISLVANGYFKLNVYLMAMLKSIKLVLLLVVDYHDIFSSVVKPTSIRLILSLMTSRGWSLC